MPGKKCLTLAIIPKQMKHKLLHHTFVLYHIFSEAFSPCWKLTLTFVPPNSLTSFWNKFKESRDLVMCTGIQNIIITGDLITDLITPSGQQFEHFVNTNLPHVKEPASTTSHTATFLNQIISKYPRLCISNPRSSSNLKVPPLYCGC